MILKIFSPKNLAKVFAFLAQTTVSFCKNCDRNIGFREKRQFFRQKLAKIAEICDHIIDPWSKRITYIGVLLICIHMYISVYTHDRNYLLYV
jgi:hypothetical protein